jgi:hypothetical protein
VNRLINPYPHPEDARAVPGADADNAVGRLMKYIPGEIISGYMLLAGLVEAAPDDSPLRPFAGWGLVVLGAVLTPFYLSRFAPNEPDPAKKLHRWHYAISTVSFLLWAYALGGPFKLGEPLFGKYPYESLLASVAAGAFSWAVALAWQPTLPKSDPVQGAGGTRPVDQPPAPLPGS